VAGSLAQLIQLYVAFGITWKRERPSLAEQRLETQFEAGLTRSGGHHGFLATGWLSVFALRHGRIAFAFRCRGLRLRLKPSCAQVSEVGATAQNALRGGSHASGYLPTQHAQQVVTD
jgi:hypothetical protein